MYKSEKKRCFIGITVSIVIMIIGYILLEYVSVMEKPPGGHTLYIIAGTALILLSAISIFFLAKHLMHLKQKEEKKRNTRIKFLDKSDYRKYSNSSKTKSRSRSKRDSGNSSSTDLINS